MTTFVKASCHCGLNVFNVAFATDSLPVTNDLCHCNSCRHSTGQLMANFVPIFGVPLASASTADPADLSTLTTYSSSTVGTRRFCGRCSAHVLWEFHKDTESSWCVASGTLERIEGIVNTTYHIWISDTLDGGIADHIQVINGVQLSRYAAGENPDNILPLGWNNVETKAPLDLAEDHLHAYCHCKAVSFWITRPSTASTLPSSPYPNLMHSSTTTPNDVALNPSDEKWWLRPAGAEHPTHYLAGHCACASCRTTSGFDIQSWAFIPRVNILFPRAGSGELAELDLQDHKNYPAGLRHYKSSAGRNREFCGTCGATVFSWEDERPELVDVAVALVDEGQAGGRAEGWFEWWKERVGFQEDVVNVKLVQGLVEGLRALKFFNLMSTLGRRLHSPIASRCLSRVTKSKLTHEALHRPFSSSQSHSTTTSDESNGHTTSGAFISERLRAAYAGGGDAANRAARTFAGGPPVLDTSNVTGSAPIEVINVEEVRHIVEMVAAEEMKKRKKKRKKQEKKKSRKARERQEEARKAKERQKEETKTKKEREERARLNEVAWREALESEIDEPDMKDVRASHILRAALKEGEEMDSESAWIERLEVEKKKKWERKEKARKERLVKKESNMKLHGLRAARAKEEAQGIPGPYSSLAKLLDGLKDAETGWGPDKLQPPTPSSEDTLRQPSGHSPRLERPDAAPHLPLPMLSYSRRIEGLVEPTTRPTLKDVAPNSKHNPIATLSHGLDRVLFNPGVHWLQDPRSKVYNFPPHLETIPQVTDFAFERLPGFIKSSHDEDLWDLARREKRAFAGSTSSLSGMLSHIYFLISGDKDVSTDNLSRHFQNESRGFTAGQRMPASVVLNHNDGAYAIDSDAEKDRMADKNILTWMGTLLEKYLTSSPEEFAPYMRFNPPPPGVKNPLRDAYRYAKSQKFVMRSQLDCQDPRLPGTGVFDVKTRACLPIRMDLLNFEENSGYLIRSLNGKMESFEREYYDLIRSAFLKYSFQVRIGNMDGVIVAYHNTARLFGFQYISLDEMDEALFGKGPGVGDHVFDKCVALLEKVVEEAAACFPGESVKCTFEKLEGEDVMNVWVQQATQPVEEAKSAADVMEGLEAPEAPRKELPPIKQLEVRASSFLGQEPTRGSRAVSYVSKDEPWTLHWSISKLASSGENIHASLDAAKERQFRHIDIPTGWDENSVAKMWNSLNFGGAKRVEGQEGPLPHGFRMPTPRTQDLRDVARLGGEETAKRLSEEEGKAKVWLGGTVEWEELLEVQELMRGKESSVTVIEEVTDEEVVAAQQTVTQEPVSDIAEETSVQGEVVTEADADTVDATNAREETTQS
ncbi:hypothetical protein DXG01_002435 [Tephrocybe rancida]|nr:hypothetical protein DXG01_002435 [Tephrocybe rancida]